MKLSAKEFVWYTHSPLNTTHTEKQTQEDKQQILSFDQMMNQFLMDIRTTPSSCQSGIQDIVPCHHRLGLINVL